jgi:curved DNA-binding protein
MENGHQFVDYYSTLQVHPECNARTLEVAYRHLAKIYHPDHPETADLDRFNSIIEAYALLRKPRTRASYDVLYTRNTGFTFASKEAGQAEGIAVVSDANIHSSILMYLYKKRRECSRSPGVGTYQILRSLNCSEENFEFHAWYLKKKGFIEVTDDGTFAITVDGVDHVISTSQTTAETRLRITQSEDHDLARWPEHEVASAMVQ